MQRPAAALSSEVTVRPERYGDEGPRWVVAQAETELVTRYGGLDAGERTFVLWLGVTPYLTEDAVYATLSELARLPCGTEVVFDYANPPHAIEDAAARNYHGEMAERVAAGGEPFRCYFETDDLHAGARRLGFIEIEDLDRSALVARYLPNSPVTPRPGPGGHVVRMAAR